MRVALFGGSFDPPHCGHIKIARAAKAALGLDRVLIAPVGRQPLKGAFHGARFPDRLKMVELAVSGESGMEASEVDAPRSDNRPNYTIDTVRILKEGLPAETELFFLMGADSLHTFRRWNQASDLLFLAEFIIAARPGFSLNDLEESLPAGVRVAAVADKAQNRESFLLERELGIQNSLHLLPNLNEDISATDIRNALKGGNPEQAIVSRAVLRYIQENNLYSQAVI